MTADVLTQNDYFSWSLNQLSREFGIARETVGKRLSDANVRPSGERRGHPVYKVKDAAMAILLPQATPGNNNNPDLMAPSDRRHHYAAELDKTKLQREQGFLVSVDDCREQLVEVIMAGLPIFDSLADELERDFGLPPEIITKVEEKVDALRVKWADKLQELE